MTTWVLMRLLKFGALLVLTAGMASVASRPSQLHRIRVAYAVVLPAFLAVWTFGYVLMQTTGLGFEPWILISMATSLISLHGTLLVAHRPAPRAISGAMAWGALAGTLVVMGLRNVEPLTLGLAAVATVVVTALSAAVAVPPSDTESEGVDAFARKAILWAGRVEGVSLLLLLAVSVGRRALDVDLGMGPKVLGWVHGALLLIWFQALWTGGRAVGWSWGTMAWGMLAALLPFGPFVFERGKQ